MTGAASSRGVVPAAAQPRPPNSLVSEQKKPEDGDFFSAFKVKLCVL